MGWVLLKFGGGWVLMGVDVVMGGSLGKWWRG